MSTPVCGSPPPEIWTLNNFVDVINATYSLRVPYLPVSPSETIFDLGNLPVTEYCRPGHNGLEVEARAKRDLALVTNVMIKEVFMGVMKLSMAELTD
jgi:hypothetical protein